MREGSAEMERLAFGGWPDEIELALEADGAGDRVSRSIGSEVEESVRDGSVGGPVGKVERRKPGGGAGEAGGLQAGGVRADGERALAPVPVKGAARRGGEIGGRISVEGELGSAVDRTGTPVFVEEIGGFGDLEPAEIEVE